MCVCVCLCVCVCVSVCACVCLRVVCACALVLRPLAKAPSQGREFFSLDAPADYANADVCNSIGLPSQVFAGQAMRHPAAEATEDKLPEHFSICLVAPARPLDETLRANQK